MKFGSTLPFGFPKSTASWKLTRLGGVSGSSHTWKGWGAGGWDGEGDHIDGMGAEGRTPS